jgi:hypothetical protein
MKNRSITIKVIRKKKAHMKTVIESVEDQTHNKRKIKKKQKIDQFKKEYQHKFNTIRNKKGELAMYKKEKEEIRRNILIN